MRGLDALMAACKRRRWGTIVWAGVGYGAAIPAVRALDARHRVYLEPNTELRSRLSQRYVLSDRETLSGTALWSATEVRPFHVLSDPLKSSLIPPDEVLKAWPNLRKVAQYDVQTQSLDALINEHEVSPEDENLLVLEIRGAESEVLAAADGALLARFTHIVVHHEETGEEDPEWLQLLARQGYEFQDQGHVQAGSWFLLRRERSAGDSAPPALPAYVLRISELEVELDHASAQDRANTELLAKQQVELLESGRRAQELTAVLDEAKRLQTQSKAENARLQEKVSGLEALTRKLEAASEEAASARAQQELAQTEVARLQAKVSALEGSIHEADTALKAEKAATAQAQMVSQSQVAQLQEKLGALQGAIQEADETLEAEKAATAQAQMVSQSQVAQLQEKVGALEGAVQNSDAALTAERAVNAEAQQALADAHQSAKLSLKLQLLRENDLRELQGRYQDSVEARDRQHQLLVKLGERLGNASRYFHLLTEASSGRPDDVADEQHPAPRIIPQGNDPEKRRSSAGKPGRGKSPRTRGASGAKTKRRTGTPDVVAQETPAGSRDDGRASDETDN